jgi:hypothetical protein
VEARTILGLCDRFHCTPDVARRMDIDVVRLLKLEELGRPETGEEDTSFAE